MSVDLISDQFFETVNDCRHIYVDQAVEVTLSSLTLSADQQSEFLDEVEVRFNRLLIKVFAEVAWSDLVWSQNEGLLAVQLLEDLLRTKIPARDVKATLKQLLEISSQESWQAVLEPFMRVTDETLGQLKNLKWQLHQFLTPPPAPPKKQAERREVNEAADQVYGIVQNAIDSANNQATQVAPKQTASSDAQQLTDTSAAAISAEEREEKLATAIEELDVLIGIGDVKSEVKGLVNFLKVQTARKAAGLPENPISLHMVFEGNPGTGKTTVAIFGAMGVLEKGHLVETDRSGLVAEFVGQTATKANKIIDSALDGVLFIDEAYSLVGDPKDSFGAEALQILLKRAEDDRDRLIVIMAGYSEQMKQLLQSNPGLSSRFARSFGFPDYSAGELSRIFSVLAEKNHYRVCASVQQKLETILESAVKSKDEHFGNGRLVRNLFEKAIRNLADRVVNVPELTPALGSAKEACGQSKSD